MGFDMLLLLLNREVGSNHISVLCRVFALNPLDCILPLEVNFCLGVRSLKLQGRAEREEDIQSYTKRPCVDPSVVMEGAPWCKDYTVPLWECY
jgi:hypothetical protein